MSNESAGPAGSGGGPRLQGVERRLTELTADQVRTRQELTTLIENHQATAGTAREAAGALSEVLPRVDEHGATLDELRGRVDALSDELAAHPNVTAVGWPALDAAQADQTWQDLAGWITDVLGPFYRITRGQLPDCWARHPDAVIELVWLHTCYREAFDNEKGRPTAAAEWHTRWRPAALAAVADAIPERLCRPGEHLIPTRESDAARSDARDARALATAPGPGGGGRGAAEGYQPPPPPAPAAAGPSDAATGPRRYDPARDQVTTPAHWGPHYQAAKADDLAWRRTRDADTPRPERAERTALESRRRLAACRRSSVRSLGRRSFRRRPTVLGAHRPVTRPSR